MVIRLPIATTMKLVGSNPDESSAGEQAADCKKNVVNNLDKAL